MLTREQILEGIKGGRRASFDGRDMNRLARFFPESDFPVLGVTLRAGATHEPEELTQENVLVQLKEDLEFAFEKALNKRGLSASAMNSVILTWLWVLEDPLALYAAYAQYGLPLLRLVALKYGFDNLIGDDVGDEHKYSAEYEGDDD